MKNAVFYLSIAAVLLSQTTGAFAADKNKIVYRLEKTRYSGFTLAEYATSQTCVIYDNGAIEITQSASNLSSSQRLKVALKGNLQETINAAAQGNITKNSAPVDAPSIIYRAYPDKFPANVKLAPISLYEKNGGSGEEVLNDSPAAVTLRNFMDMNCN